MNCIRIFPLLLLASICGCNSMQEDSARTISISSDTIQSLPGTAIFIPLEKIGRSSQDEHFPVIIRNGDTIGSELIQSDANGLPDQLFFLADLTKQKTATYRLSWTNNPPLIEKQVNIRFGARTDSTAVAEPVLTDTFYPAQLPWRTGFQRFQTDGPTWENDKVGFRIYLDGRNSIDVFGKTKPAITPAGVGIGADGKPEYNYAQMLDWGTDILAVGNSVGIGGIALKHGESLQRLGVTDKDTINNVAKTITRVLNSGKLFASLRIDYQDWKPAEQTYQAQMTMKTWPGFYGFQNTVEVQGLQPGDTMLAGLVNSNTEKELSIMSGGRSNDLIILYTHDKQSVDKQTWLGLALIIPKKNYAGYLKAPATGSVATSYFAKLVPEEEQPVTYYALACWELTDPGFAQLSYFENYLKSFANQISTSITPDIK